RLLYSSSPSHLPPFPARRSSDLKILTGLLGIVAFILIISVLTNGGSSGEEAAASGDDVAATEQAGDSAESGTSGQAENVEQADRSEEHTSELQSRFDLVCRLLLE